MDVVAGNGVERELQPEPFPEGSRFWHLGPVQVRFTAHKDVQVHLGDKGLEFHDLGILEWRGRETSNVAKSQPDMTRGFGPGRGSPKVESARKRDKGECLSCYCYLLNV